MYIYEPLPGDSEHECTCLPVLCKSGQNWSLHWQDKSAVPKLTSYEILESEVFLKGTSQESPISETGS